MFEKIKGLDPRRKYSMLALALVAAIGILSGCLWRTYQTSSAAAAGVTLSLKEAEEMAASLDLSTYQTADTGDYRLVCVTEDPTVIRDMKASVWNYEDVYLLSYTAYDKAESAYNALSNNDNVTYVDWYVGGGVRSGNSVLYVAEQNSDVPTSVQEMGTSQYGCLTWNDYSTAEEAETAYEDISQNTAVEYAAKTGDISAETVNTKAEQATNRVLLYSDLKNKEQETMISGLEGLEKTESFGDMRVLTFSSVEYAEEAQDVLNSTDGVTADADIIIEQDEDFNTEEVSFTNGSGKRVAVIDTGVNGASKSYDMTGEGTEDKNGHGTLIAGIISEESGGDAEIISIKAMNEEGVGSVSTVYAAIEMAIGLDVDVINLSAGSNYQVQAQCILDAIAQADAAGITVVVAAGNDGTSTDYYTPANSDHAIVVSAVDGDGAFASYSNHGSTVQYSALGEEENYKGTSIACARVAGAVVKSGLPLTGADFGNEGWDEYYGNATIGFIQSSRATQTSEVIKKTSENAQGTENKTEQDLGVTYVHAEEDPAAAMADDAKDAVTGDNVLVVQTKDDSVTDGLTGLSDAYEKEDTYILSFDSEESKETAKKTLEDSKKTVSIMDNTPVELTDTETNQEAIEEIFSEDEESDEEMAELEDGLTDGAFTTQTVEEPSDDAKTVAVIDTGVNDADEFYDFTGEGVSDENGHGTLVASLIESSANESVKIISIKALDSEGHGTVAAMYAAVELAIEKNVDLINISAVTSYGVDAEILQNAVKEAVAAGITVVAAAGNDSSDVKYFAPANVEEAVVVSAVEEDGQFASYSNHGTTVDYSALGTYGDLAGTSFACARVTGHIIDFGLDGLARCGYEAGEDGWGEYFGNLVFDVDSVYDTIPDDSYEYDIFGMDWESMTDEDLDNALNDAPFGKLLIWFRSLNEEDRTKILAKDTVLSRDAIVAADDGGSERYPYYQLLDSYDLSDVNSAITATNNIGSFTIYFIDNANNTVGSATVNIQFSSKTFNESDDDDQVTNNIKKVWLSNASGVITGVTKNFTTTLFDSNGDQKWVSFAITFTKQAYTYMTIDKQTKYGDSTFSFRKNITQTNKKGNSESDNDVGGLVTTNTSVTGQFLTSVNNLGITDPGTKGSITYKFNSIPLTVNYNANGGSGSVNATSMTYNTAGSLSSSKFSRTGYTQTGWKNGSTVYTLGQNVYPTSLCSLASGKTTKSAAVTLYAVWTANSYTVTLNANGGSVRTSSYKVTYNASTNSTVNTASRPGYTFAGWYTAASGGTQVYDASGKAVKGNSYWNSNGNWCYANNVTLYAHWTANTYTLTINPNGGEYAGTTGNTTRTLTYMSKNCNSIGTPTRTGYTFAGWYTGNTQVYDASGKWVTGTYWNSSGQYQYVGNLTITAKWTANQYDLILNPSGGEINNSKVAIQVTTKTSKLVFGSNNWNDVAEYTPTKRGMKFIGWYDASGVQVYDANGKCVNGTYWNNGTYNYPNSMTLYAHYDVGSYTIILKDTDGSTEQTEEDLANAPSVTLNATYGSGCQLPYYSSLAASGFTVPEGMRFAYWSLNPDGTGYGYSDGSRAYNLVDSGETAVLYAQYSDNDEFITYRDTIMNFELEDMVVQKVWVDENNRRNRRPVSIDIDIYQNGKWMDTVTLNDNNNWQTTLSGLRVYDDNGVAYEYSIQESSATWADGSATADVPKDYDVTYTQDDVLLTATNTLTTVYGSIGVEKLDQNAKALEGVTFALYTTDTDYSGNETYTYNGTTYFLRSVQSTPEDGKILWEELIADEDVKYLIVETETVDGQTLLSKPIDVGSLPVEANAKPTEDYEGDCDYEDGVYKYYNIWYTVTDDVTSNLPATGSTPDGFILSMVGMCAAVCGGAWLVMSKRKKNGLITKAKP